MENLIPEVFVLWHPRCSLGEFLARRIHRWLRPGNGVGPQVFFRSLASPERGLPPPLPGERPVDAPPSHKGSSVSNLQIVLLLIDEQMIADAAWRCWLVRLAKAPELGDRRVFAPVALDSTAYNVPPPLNELNFLRPAGLPLPVEQDPAETAKEIVARSLLRQLTETMCTLLLRRRRPATRDASDVPATANTAIPKVKVFLSHAKADGTTPAKRLRDYIYSQTQLAAFYDENDIPFGSAFSQILDSDLDADRTAALIAVRSAQYASRPWCRREISLFRRPLLVTTVDPERPAPQHWRLNPTIVVEAIEGGRQTHGIPELGNTAIIRWTEEVKDQEEQIVTTVLRDVLLGAYHLALGHALARTLFEPKGAVILNWLPDPTTLLHVTRLRANEDLTVYYPGRGLSGMELDILEEFFPRLTFCSFEEVIS